MNTYTYIYSVYRKDRNCSVSLVNLLLLDLITNILSLINANEHYHFMLAINILQNNAEIVENYTKYLATQGELYVHIIFNKA